nr:hypothetical protein [Tanacetum cinerariifolium]
MHFLKRSLYGLNQAPRAWFQHFASYAIRAGFYHSRCDTSLFIFQQGSQEFDMADLGALNYFLGIFATRSSTGLFLYQKKYAYELLEHSNMVNCDPSWTPVDTDSKLGPEGVAVQDPTLYRSDNLLSWSSKRQHSISRSSAEAKYRGVANVVAETAWLRNLLCELHSPLSTATLARLVANGSSQQQGIDVDETFSPVFKPPTIRTVLSLAVSRKWPIHQLDVKNAFLKAFSIWTESSTSCLVSAFCKLCHSGWVLSQSLQYFSFYLPTGQIITSLHQEFDMADLGALSYFLGISAMRSSTGLFLSQKKYAYELLERANMVNCDPSRTPVDTDSKLGPEGVAVQDPTLYRSLAGGLQYLTFTRPDLSYAVQHICLYMHDPREPHFASFKRILHAVYLSANPVQHQRTKHIEIDIHFIHDMVQTGHIRVLHVPSRYQHVDIFTKGLPTALFEDFRSSLSAPSRSNCGGVLVDIFSCIRNNKY